MTLGKSLPLAAAALMMLGACVVETQPAQPSLCRPADAAKLVGQINPSEQIIRAVSGAEIVRILGPNQPMTLDFRAERVTIIRDPVIGRVLRATCG